MKTVRELSLSLGACLSLLCTGPALAQPPAPGLIATDKGGAVGYQHSMERSRFLSGPPGVALRRLDEHGFAKVVGPDGVFATHLGNGLVIATPSNGSSKEAVGVLAPPPDLRYTLGPDKHNAQVIEYFRAAGVPGDQMGGVHANTYLSSHGTTNESRPAQPQVDGYASILERTVGRFSVVDSVAWARLSNDGRVVSEWVYWPAIPAKVLEDARRLEALVASGDKSGFLARLPSGLPSGKVVIRHSSAVVDGGFEAFASYDIAEKVLVPSAIAGTGPGASRPTASMIVRHFDVDGVERRLPQERRSVGQDSPRQ
ncbi:MULTISPECIES: hypothetical protein [Myxococcus]|uniref:hypothetical protein n=1 Tax=Myxococcus TaxID=32 RepID=UPI0013CFD96B|nr:MULTISPECIES: hypothetical protein [Myxococcus]NVJ22403.1 hypothetical protein [Myxococcus sp. AM011]